MKNRPITLFLSLFLLSAAGAFAQGQVREEINFDFDWKFSLTDQDGYKSPDFDDQSWEDVQLPHDWNIKQDMDMRVDGSAAHLPEGIGWYRKTFDVPSSYSGKHVTIEFDGIFQQSDVYINDHHLGNRPYGFCSIVYDLTPYLKCGESNVIAVRVNTTGGRPRWYGGGGIYRHVKLHVTQPVHVAVYGTYITTPEVSENQATVNIVTTVNNASTQDQELAVSQRILDSKGKVVAKSKTEKGTAIANQSIDLTQSFSLPHPELWDTEHPVLYQMETTVKVGSETTDVYLTTFGVRTIAFDPDKGFILNGKQVKLKGLCLHQDAGSLGVAVPDRSYERRLEILKEYGCNALRMAHNQPAATLLEMCDKMGFLVIDEAFDKWKSGYYEKYFDEWWQKDLGNMVLRDRNHPSVILWSIGNELQEAWNGDLVGVKRARMLQKFVHEMEPTRPVTMAVQNGHQERFARVTDVVGYNYLEARLISDHKKYPDNCFLVSEELPYFCGEEGNIRSYTPYNPWNYVRDNDFIAGGFIWSGVDYLGEAAGPSGGWPNGLFDVCMFEKPRAAYHRSQWNDDPIVRIAVMDPSLDIEHGRDLWQWPLMAAHWNFPQKYIGLVMEIRTITNCEEVELFMNDRSVGKHATSDYPNNTIVWYLPYTPGKLSAKGYNAGQEVASYELITSKDASTLSLTPDRTTIKADRQDLTHIAIQLMDENGNPVQTDDRMISVEVEGDGHFLCIDNGDLRMEKTFANKQLKTYFGKALIVVQSTGQAGQITVKVKADGIDQTYVSEIATVNP